MEFFHAICLLSLSCLTFQLFSKLLSQWRHQRCYVLHYECFLGRSDRKLDTRTCGKIVLRNTKLGLDEYRFSLKTIARSGIGEQTYAPAIYFSGHENSPSLADAHFEMDEIIFPTLDNLFDKTSISPSQVDILVINVSLFSPVPSLVSRVVNRYKMKEDIKAFNLSGMGCSAGIISINLVQNLFKSYKNSIAVIVSTESIAPNWYSGKQKSMLISNILFRSGGCSILLTNNPSLKHRAIMKLNCLVHTHHGSSDEAYECCFQNEDELGYRGFQLTRNLPKVGVEALDENMKVLMPKVLPFKELLRLGYVYLRSGTKLGSGMRVLREALNLKAGIEHFCLHPGGQAVLNGIGKSLRLSEEDLEPAKMAFHRFGNTSSSSHWYVLGYMEAKRRLKKGDRVLMCALGAGFMCLNCVWEVTRDLEDENVWKDFIADYPLETLASPFEEEYGWITDQSLNPKFEILRSKLISQLN